MHVNNITLAIIWLYIQLRSPSIQPHDADAAYLFKITVVILVEIESVLMEEMRKVSSSAVTYRDGNNISAARCAATTNQIKTPEEYQQVTNLNINTSIRFCFIASGFRKL